MVGAFPLDAFVLSLFQHWDNNSRLGTRARLPTEICRLIPGNSACPAAVHSVCLSCKFHFNPGGLVLYNLLTRRRFLMPESKCAAGRVQGVAGACGVERPTRCIGFAKCTIRNDCSRAPLRREAGWRATVSAAQRCKGIMWSLVRVVPVGCSCQ